MTWIQWGDLTSGRIGHDLKILATIRMHRRNGLWFARIGSGSVEMSLSGHDSASINRLETPLPAPSSVSTPQELSDEDLLRTTTALTASLNFDLPPDPADNIENSDSNGMVSMAERTPKHIRMAALRDKQHREVTIPDRLARPSHFQEFNWHQCNICTAEGPFLSRCLQCSRPHAQFVYPHTPEITSSSQHFHIGMAITPYSTIDTTHVTYGCSVCLASGPRYSGCTACHLRFTPPCLVYTRTGSFDAIYRNASARLHPGLSPSINGISYYCAMARTNWPSSPPPSLPPSIRRHRLRLFI